MSNQLIYRPDESIRLEGDQAIIELFTQDGFPYEVINKIQSIAEKRGFKIEVDNDPTTLNPNIRLFTDLRYGRNVADQMREFQHAITSEADPDKKIDVEIVQATTDPNVFDSLKMPEEQETSISAPPSESKNIIAKGVDVIQKRFSKEGYDKNQKILRIKQIISENAGNPAILEQLHKGGVTKESIQKILLELRIINPVDNITETSVLTLIDLFNAYAKEMKVIGPESQVTDALLRKSYEILFRDFRLKEAFNRLKKGTEYNFFKFTNKDFLKIFEGYDLDRFAPYFANIFRDFVLQLPEGSDEEKKFKKFATFLSFPPGSSSIERNRLALDSIVDNVRTLNTNKMSVLYLGSLLQLTDTVEDQNINPVLLDLVKHLQVLSIFSPNDEIILRTIFTEDFTLKSQDKIIDRVFEFVSKHFDDLLIDHAYKATDALPLSEAVSLIGYIYSSKDDSTIRDHRNIFLNLFVDEYAREMEDGSAKMHEILMSVVRVLNTIRRTDPGITEALNTYRINEIKEKIQTQNPEDADLPDEIKSVNNEKKKLKILVRKDLTESKSNQVQIEADGSIPMLSNLYLENPSTFENDKTDLFRHINYFITHLKRKGVYQYFVSLLHNNNDSEAARKEIFKIFYNLQGNIQNTFNDIRKYFENSLESANNSEQVSKYITAKFLTDIITARTRKDNIASRAEAYPEEFGAIKSLNLPENVEKIVKDAMINRKTGMLDAYKLTSNELEIVLFEIKKAEVKKELIAKISNLTDIRGIQTIIERSIQILSEDIKQRYPVPYVEELYLKPLKQEFYTLRRELLSHPKVGATLGWDFSKVENEVNETLRNLYALVGKRSKLIEVNLDVNIADVSKLNSLIQIFVKEYRERIGSIEVKPDRAKEDFKSAIDKWRNNLETKFTDVNNATISPEKEAAIREEFSAKLRSINLDNLNLYQFAQTLSTNQTGIGNIIQLSHFVELYSDKSFANLSQEQFSILFYLVKGNSADIRYIFNPIDGNIVSGNDEKYSETKTSELAKTLFKALQQYAINLYTAREFQRSKADEVSKQIAAEQAKEQEKKKEVKKPDVSVPATVEVMGKKIEARDVGRAEKVANRIKNIFRREQQVKSEPKTETQRKLETSDQNRKALNEVLSGLPDDIKTITNNLILAEIAKEKVEKAERDLKRLREVVYPSIKGNLEKSERKRVERGMDLNQIPFARRAINDAYNKINDLMKKDIYTEQELQDISTKLLDLINSVHDAMRSLINDMEKTATLTKNAKNMSKVVELRELSNQYTPEKQITNGNGKAA